MALRRHVVKTFATRHLAWRNWSTSLRCWLQAREPLQKLPVACQLPTKSFRHSESLLHWHHSNKKNASAYISHNVVPLRSWFISPNDQGYIYIFVYIYIYLYIYIYGYIKYKPSSNLPSPSFSETSAETPRASLLEAMTQKFPASGFPQLHGATGCDVDLAPLVMSI